MQKSNTQLSANVVKRFMVDSRARLIGLLGAAAVAGLSLATLLPTHWVPRTGLGWENEHFIVYFTTTIILSLASRKPYVVAIGLTTFAGVLEACQGLTPDRFPDLTAALSGAVGVMSAATLVILAVWAKRALPIRDYFSASRQWLLSFLADEVLMQAHILSRAFRFSVLRRVFALL
jgi:VanZ family protein